MGCNYLSLSFLTASGAQVLNWSFSDIISWCLVAPADDRNWCWFMTLLGKQPFKLLLLAQHPSPHVLGTIVKWCFVEILFLHWTSKCPRIVVEMIDSCHLSKDIRVGFFLHTGIRLIRTHCSGRQNDIGILNTPDIRVTIWFEKSDPHKK